jgi:hypothetical protein
MAPPRRARFWAPRRPAIPLSANAQCNSPALGAGELRRELQRLPPAQPMRSRGSPANFLESLSYVTRERKTRCIGDNRSL